MIYILQVIEIIVFYHCGPFPTFPFFDLDKLSFTSSLVENSYAVLVVFLLKS